MIYAAYERNADSGNRPHLGASLIGHHCERYLWYVFHWAESKKFPGRILRLFDTGKREEARIIEDLRNIGCAVFADDGSSQYRVSAIGGHFGGSMDAVLHGYHEAPTQYMPCEMKTHNAKSYKELTEKRVEKAKPMHYAQMQVYMGLSGMTRALYFAVNKDTDDIYTEYVHFDKEEYGRLFQRASRVINANEPPLRISEDQTFYLCKFCDMASICHGTAAPQVNCRTCCHSTPDTQAGGWKCDHQETYVDGTACDGHRYIPILLEKFATMTDANQKENWVKYQNKLTGKEFYNGDLSSEEIRDCQDKRALGDDGVQNLRHELGAKVAA
jgi:hypothetical protein